MVKTNLLRAEFVKNGMKEKDVAMLLGMTQRTLSRKLKTGVFGTDEAEILIRELSIKNAAEIFLASE